jgi:hypothetical protein
LGWPRENALNVAGEGFSMPPQLGPPTEVPPEAIKTYPCRSRLDVLALSLEDSEDGEMLHGHYSVVRLVDSFMARPRFSVSELAVPPSARVRVFRARFALWRGVSLRQRLF